MFLIILAAIAIAFVVDLVVALFAMWLGPLTGIAFLTGLGFWNWFAIVVLSQVLTWTATVNK